MEIEKKFLVRDIPDELENAEKWEISQGYLCTLENAPTIRIRKVNDLYNLTYKSRAGVKQERNVIINQEEEFPITRECFEHLAGKVDGHLITKTRYRFPIGVRDVAELDIFHGALEGLCLVEVEFSTIQDAKDFIAPDWFGEDVSDDASFRNASLAIRAVGIQASGLAEA